jgi:hypothetical protein
MLSRPAQPMLPPRTQAASAVRGFTTFSPRFVPDACFRAYLTASLGVRARVSIQTIKTTLLMKLPISLLASLATFLTVPAVADDARISGGGSAEPGRVAAAGFASFDTFTLAPLAMSEDGALTLFNGTTLQPPRVAVQAVDVPTPPSRSVESPRSHFQRRLTLVDGTVIHVSRRVALPYSARSHGKRWGAAERS